MDRQKDMTLKDEGPGSGLQYWVRMEKIAVERVKRLRLSQSRNEAQLWSHLVVKVKSDAVRTILHGNLEC